MCYLQILGTVCPWTHTLKLTQGKPVLLRCLQCPVHSFSPDRTKGNRFGDTFKSHEKRLGHAGKSKSRLQVKPGYHEVFITRQAYQPSAHHSGKRPLACDLRAHVSRHRNITDNHWFVREMLGVNQRFRTVGGSCNQIAFAQSRSEERRVGKECRSRW